MGTNLFREIPEIPLAAAGSVHLIRRGATGIVFVGGGPFHDRGRQDGCIPREGGASPAWRIFAEGGVGEGGFSWGTFTLYIRQYEISKTDTCPG